MLIRRKRPQPPFMGYTDANGAKTPDAPKYWPFGTRVPMKSIANPRVKRPIEDAPF